ncbi:hypothetical protein [Azospirillum rugosum]|uniref:Uncharacterized protein n=1 Tax=Azospirillum rugosum TaxID=416170 RepID=A0ABS4SK20_9PROT|nr:hypothetical protein [Azospirillum rugosum]MBP2292433.1 hypothetical protein [Azospirillum rugosum]MDQ0526192.1 hypothetical protein [Azospirillum rugosum]
MRKTSALFDACASFCLCGLLLSGAANAGETRSYEIEVRQIDLENPVPRPKPGVPVLWVKALPPARNDDFQCEALSDDRGIIRCEVRCEPDPARIRQHYEFELKEQTNYNAVRRQRVAVAGCTFRPDRAVVEYEYYRARSYAENVDRIGAVFAAYPALAEITRAGNVIDGVQLSLALSGLDGTKEGRAALATVATSAVEAVDILRDSDMAGDRKRFETIAYASANAIIAAVGRRISAVSRGNFMPGDSEQEYRANLRELKTRAMEAPDVPALSRSSITELYSLSQVSREADLQTRGVAEASAGGAVAGAIVGAYDRRAKTSVLAGAVVGGTSGGAHVVDTHIIWYSGHGVRNEGLPLGRDEVRALATILTAGGLPTEIGRRSGLPLNGFMGTDVY